MIREIFFLSNLFLWSLFYLFILYVTPKSIPIELA